MDARLPAHQPVRAITNDLEYGFLDSIQDAGRERDRFQFEAIPREKSLVHPMEVSREERGLVTARARADLDDGITIVERITRDDERLERLLELRDARLEAGLLRACFVGELRVVNENELANLRELVFVLAEPAGQLHDRSETPVLSSQLGQLMRLAQRCRISERPLDISRAS